MGVMLVFGGLVCLGIACLRWPRYAFFAVVGPMHPKHRRTGQPITRADRDALTESDLGVPRVAGVMCLMIGLVGGALTYLSSR